jgi:hypothetical protein
MRTSKAIVNKSSVLKKERKEDGKEGERVERERGGKGVFFSLQRTHNACVSFLGLSPSLLDKKTISNYEKTTKNPTKKRKIRFFSVFSLFFLRNER